MTAFLVAATAAVVAGLAAALLVYLRMLGRLVDSIAGTLADKVAPGARMVAGHVDAAGPGLDRLNRALARLVATARR
jgi:hypothetical protein